jgi:hypothetical protein
MRLQFASCQRNYVLEFLTKGYPDSDVSAETLPKLMSGIDRDIVRITDPSYHQLALVCGDNYKPSDEPELREIAAEIMALSNKPKQEGKTR